MTTDMVAEPLKNFDNIELLRPAKAFHIDRLVIYYGRFITGISVTFKLDGKHKTVDHIGTD